MNITKFPCDDCKLQNIYYACEQSSCEKYKEYKKLKDINPLYIELARIAYDTVLHTMLQGEKTHPDNDWQDVSIIDHICHAGHHIDDYITEDTSEDHIAHAITRLAIIKYLEGEEEERK